MIFKVLTILFAVFTIYAAGDSVNYKVCTAPAGSGEVVDVRVDPCPPHGDGGCILKRGNSVNIEIDFKPSENSNTLKHVVHGMIGDFPMPYLGLGPPDACAKLDPKPDPCSIEAGQTYHYKSTMNVLSSYPEIELKVRWQLIGPDNTVQACVLIPVKVGS